MLQVYSQVIQFYIYIFFLQILFPYMFLLNFVKQIPAIICIFQAGMKKNSEVSLEGDLKPHLDVVLQTREGVMLAGKYHPLAK